MFSPQTRRDGGANVDVRAQRTRPAGGRMVAGGRIRWRYIQRCRQRQTVAHSTYAGGGDCGLLHLTPTRPWLSEPRRSKHRATPAGKRPAAGGNDLQDHPPPSGCAFSLRIDERREGGHGAPRPLRRGSIAREDKEFRRILIFPPGERACGRPCATRQSRNPCLPLSHVPRAGAVGVAAATRAPAGRARRAGCRRSGTSTRT